jgi:hypothetical protein
MFALWVTRNSSADRRYAVSTAFPSGKQSKFLILYAVQIPPAGRCKTQKNRRAPPRRCEALREEYRHVNRHVDSGGFSLSFAHRAHAGVQTRRTGALQTPAASPSTHGALVMPPPFSSTIPFFRRTANKGYPQSSQGQRGNNWIAKG